jgi:hypothetical protein
MQHSVIEGRAWKSEGMETNCYNAVLGAWLDVCVSSGRLLCKFGSKVAPIHSLLPSLWRACPSMPVTVNNPV